VQVAAGKRGIDRIELPVLSVLRNIPVNGQQDVSTELTKVEIELSSVLPASTVLGDYVKVLEGNPQFGVDVSNKFTIDFGQRNGQPARRFIELTRVATETLQPNTQYYVIVKAGLAPLTGQPLVHEYQFSFVTSAAGASALPDIASVTPATGGIEGGTPIVVRGLNFGVNPILFLGGQALVVDHVEAATTGDPYEKIYATTVPNYAGPAAVEVVNDAQLHDFALGAFTYVDILQISFIDPPVVRVSQTGTGDQVRIVGYGFHDGIKLRAYPTGQSDKAVVDVVDNDRLTLYSAEQLQWVVPDFGQSFRGYVDVEISDANGRRYILPNALFYGRLAVDRRLTTEKPFTLEEISQLLGDAKSYVPDALKLPSGNIRDIASDPALGLVYVLGGGISPTTLAEVKSLDDFHHYIAPGWISLVHYDRNALGDAAPMHGLGYYNLPQDLTPTAMRLTDKQMYVTAAGAHFPFIDTPYEDQRVVLVYDREDRLPGANPAQESKDRDILYSLPLSFTEAPTAMTSSGNLLFVASPADGVGVISLTDPKRPVLLRIIKTATIDGAQVTLHPKDVQVINNTLHIVDQFGRFVFDMSKPSMPQLSFSQISGSSSAVLRSRSSFVQSLATGPVVYDSARPESLRELGRYDGRGFSLPGLPVHTHALTSLAGSLKANGCDLGEFSASIGGLQISSNIHKPGNEGYLTLFDTSRPELISLLDGVKVLDCSEKETVGTSLLTDDGIALATTTGESTSELIFVDTLTPDLIKSIPAQGMTSVPTGQVVDLYFSYPIEIPNGTTELAYLSSYLALLYDDGSAQGQSIAFTSGVDVNDPHHITMTPSADLLANSQYRIVLKGVLGSRRTVGLFDHVIEFDTASNNDPAPAITMVAPTNVLTTGGQITVTVENGNSPTFLVAEVNAPVVSSTVVDAQHTSYVIDVAAGFSGPAELLVENANGARANLLGGVQYVEPLSLISVDPAQGSMNGGSTVTIKGTGFRPGLGQVQVSIGDVPVTATDIKVLDGNTITVVTPGGRIGKSDVLVTLDSGQKAMLKAAYEYLQPIQSNIAFDSHSYTTAQNVPDPTIYDAQLDASGTYLIAAAGKAGVVIFNVNASTYTNGQSLLNLDDLRRLVDLNGDKIDDRFLVTVPLPDDYVALGIDGYFERSSDRVFVTAAKFDASGSVVPDSARLFIIAFDSTNVQTTSIVASLPLPADFARGIGVKNNRAVIAMGKAGVGLVDSYLQTKTYLTSQVVLPNGQSALDVSPIDAVAGQNSLYAVAAGHFNFSRNALEDGLDTTTGGFYILEQDPANGLKVISSVPIPSSRVVVAGQYAYLAAGDAGMAIVDISDPLHPQIVARVNDRGHVYDVDVIGNTAYLALGTEGILTVDVTNPRYPVSTGGMEAFGGKAIQVVVAGSAAAYSAGTGIVQVVPDVVLKIHRIDPINRILDQDADGNLKVFVRFNKAIDLWPDNLHRFEIRGPDGQSLPIDTQIINNDAILTLRDASNLQVGDQITVLTHAGVKTVKPLTANRFVELYSLAQDQSTRMTYRGSRPDNLRLEAVVPRRVLKDKSQSVTISGLGIPLDPSRVRVYIGSTPVTISAIQSSDTVERTAVITAQIPALNSAGLYDVQVEVEKDGLWQKLVLYGGLMVDAPIQFDSISPKWGPRSGGTRVTITGSGFEPGNTVMEGLKIRIGAVPVANIQVLSTRKLEVITRGGIVGRNNVYGEDRYGDETSLIGDDGFGYGMKLLANQHAGKIYPSDVEVDQETGVAITNGGYFDEVFKANSDGQIDSNSGLFQVYQGVAFPDPIRAASFDIQNPLQPLLVGGSPTVPSGTDRQSKLSLMAEYVNLSAKQRASEADFMISIGGSGTTAPGFPNFTAEDAMRLDELKYSVFPTNIDSIRVEPVQERENGILHKRLYIASGNGGVARLNLDDQTGMQVLSESLWDVEQPSWQVTDTLKWGQSLFATRSKVGPPPLGGAGCPPALGTDEGRELARLNYADVNDPVQLDKLVNISGGNVVIRDDEWLYSGGQRKGKAYDLRDLCNAFESFSSTKPGKLTSGGATVTAVNLFDLVLTRTYQFTNNIYDLATYGDYLIAALGDGGLEILHKERPDERAIVSLDKTLQQVQGSAVRLKRYANLLFVSSASGGVVVLDIANPMSPYVVSAGNTENVEGVDIYKDRVISVSSEEGMNVLQLPASFVMASSVDEGELISDSEDLVLTFNEEITDLSLQQSGAVSVKRLDTGMDVATTVTAIDPVENHAKRFALNFTREAGVKYEIRVNDARNLRSSGLWRPFVLHTQAAAAGAIRPVITDVQGGVFHRGYNQALTILGSGFRNDAAFKVYVDQYEVTPQWVDANTLVLPAGALELLPLQLGEHHLRIVDSGLTAAMPGAIVIGEDLSLVTFKLSRDSGSVKGGVPIEITSSDKAILPGSKVILRPRQGNDIRTLETAPGIYVSNLHDDVVTLDKFRFILPGVVDPGLYQVLLSTGGQEVPVGEFSYTMESGRGIDLPNYPPMEIGGAETVGDTLFVGVKAGSPPTKDNRFLMEAGLEIYDISIWDRPVRLSQLPMKQPVSGVATFNFAAYMASGSDGLVVADIHDTAHPIIVNTFPVPGNIATDVAVHKGRGILAMSAANSLGSGFIRFFDLKDPQMDAPLGYSTISFTQGDLLGQPIDVQWLGDSLYVLLRRNDQLYMAIFDNLDTAMTYTVQSISRGDVHDVDLLNTSFVVQYGQIGISTGRDYLILQKGASGYDTVYWQATESDSNELFANQGSLFLGSNQGVVDTPTPDLAITNISPSAGASLSTADTIRVDFNELINTDATQLLNDIKLLDSTGSAIPADAYTLTGINTLAGGYVNVTFTAALTYSGPLTVSVTTGMTGLGGHHLLEQLDTNYILVAAAHPVIASVSRVVNSVATQHYFHADGTEVGMIVGSNFGTDPTAIQLTIGEQVLTATDILSVTDNEIRFNMPNLYLGIANASLSVTVNRAGIAETQYGAIVVLPITTLDDITPDSSPPQGGNIVDLYGRGFNQSVKILFGGNVAGDANVLSSNHMQVRAPSGSFGHIDVAVDNALFPDEHSVLSGAYFYAGRETGSVNLAQDGRSSSPVTAIALHDQILYAVTGGGYEAVDREGTVLGQLSTTKAQLVVSDISDPVHPVLINKNNPDGSESAYHMDINLPPDGLREIAVSGNDMFLIGGNHLYHFDITLAAEPLLLNDYTLDANSVINGLTVSDGLIYISGDFGIRIYQELPDRKLLNIRQIDVAQLGGIPSKLAVDEDKLRVMLPDQAQILELDLMSGNFDIINTIELVDLGANPITPDSMLVRDNLLFVSTGRSGSVIAYDLRPNGGSLPVAQLPLAYLINGGDITAGNLMLYGQTLYVAGGQGDLQLFDISPWLDGRYNAKIDLNHYFAVTGSVGAIAYGDDVLYAGTSFVYVNNVPKENPLDVGVQIGNLGGALNTIVNDQLNISEQTPLPRGVLPAGQAIEIQFNRILDGTQIRDFGSTLFEVTLAGNKVDGFVSSQINNKGSRLIFRPAQDFLANKEYRVTISSALADLHGTTLANDYSFRFIAADTAEPRIDSVRPSYGSWHGGTEVTIAGSNFDINTQVVIGGQTIATQDVLRVSDNELTFRLPPLRAPPQINRTVGVSVSNGALEDFRAGRFTYVADPIITAAGGYDLTNNSFNSSQKRFIFNSGDYAAIEGFGLNALTTIKINGKAVPALKVVDARHLAFQIPDNALGQLHITASNLPNEIDLVRNDELQVELQASTQVSGNKNETVLATNRSEDLLLATAIRDYQGSTTYISRIYTTRDGAAPVLLSEINLGVEVVNAAAISEKYVIYSLGPQHELAVYDITNVYAPKLLNRIHNTQNVAQHRIDIIDDTYVAQSDGAILVGHVRGANWQTITAATRDMATDTQYIYLLYDNRVEARPIYTPTTVAATYYHVVLSPSSITHTPQRLLIHGIGQVEVLNTAYITDKGTFTSLGSANITGLVDAAIGGEIMATVTGPSSDQRLQLYDMTPSNGIDARLTLRYLADVNLDKIVSSPQDFTDLRFRDDLLEWGAYNNVMLPIPNIVRPVPVKYLANNSDAIQLRATAAASAWDKVILDVHQESDAKLLAGDTRLFGDFLQFRPIGDRYLTGDSYTLSLFNNPNSHINGVELHYDMPWRMLSAPLFGVTPINLQNVAPNSTITARSTTFTLAGQHLQQTEQIRLNDTIIPKSDWVVNADGTSITLSATLTTAGVYSVNLSQAGQVVTLPAAILVDQALAATGITTDFPNQPTKVSDAGGTKVIIAGSGFEGGLSVHWLETNAGYVADASNKVPYTLTANGLEFLSPAAEHGKSYQVVLRKTATQEEVIPTANLIGEDNTPPALQSRQPLNYTTPLRLTFNEAMQVTSFSVISQYADYSGKTDEDVSSLFELHVLGNTVELRPAVGASLQHNRIYKISLTGISDAHGNMPLHQNSSTYILQGGIYKDTFTSQDTLAPRDISLIRNQDGQPVTQAMTLTRGRSYKFTVSSTDNSLGTNLHYEVRLSVNGGLSFDAPKTLSGNSFEHEVQESDGNIAFRIKATDASGNYSEQRFDAAVVDPTLNVSPVYTNPTPVEEISRADIRFDLTGDVDLVKTVEMRVRDSWYPVKLESTNATSGRVSLSYLNPKLVDIQPDTQIPVRLRITYGFTNIKVVDDSYTLVLDATPPTLNIVSPADGDRIILGEPADVLIKSFDRYGIDRVEVQKNGGGYVALTNPTQFTFTPTTSDPVTIDARAWDSNGNVSQVASVTLQPYDAAAGEPHLAIISPVNGSLYHGGEDINLEVVMRNITSANLYYDIAGVTSSTPAATITRSASDPERFIFTSQLPDVPGDTVVVVRLESAGLKARLFLNVISDKGISQTPAVTLLPEPQILGGTELWINSTVPEGMDDFSESSEITVQDPSTDPISARVAMNVGPRSVPISNTGTSVTVHSILRDRSHHEKHASSVLTKQPYWGNVISTVFTPTNSDNVVEHMLLVPGLHQSADSLVWATNRRGGGYQIQDSVTTIESQATGKIDALYFTGTGILAQETQAGDRKLLFWPIRNGFLSAV